MVFVDTRDIFPLKICFQDVELQTTRQGFFSFFIHRHTATLGTSVFTNEHNTRTPRAFLYTSRGYLRRSLYFFAVPNTNRGGGRCHGVAPEAKRKKKTAEEELVLKTHSSR